jgi:two-component system sensor histidine kinase ArlS
MPVRIRITLLFASLAFVILALVCGGIYYFSYQARINSIKARLANRAITTARLLSQREIFTKSLVQQIDSLTTLSLKNKVVQAYDDQNRRIYTYSDLPGDTLHLQQDIFSNAKAKEAYYFTINGKEAVAYYHTKDHTRIVVVSAAADIEGKSGLRTLSRILLFSFLAGNILVLASGYFFSRGLLRPVKKITEDVEVISAHNLSRRIHTGKSNDEWYQLAHTLNNLLNRLQESFELQRRFISNASHELSTPLTAISSQIEVSLQRERSAEEYKKVMVSIHQDVLHMNKLTQALLEFAKASGDPGGLNFDLIRLDEVVLRLPAEMARIDARFIVKIDFAELPENEEKLLVFGNETLLLSAINNIVLNACKYSDDRTAMVQLKPVRNDWVVSIRDRGHGIAVDDLDKIFQPFYRGEVNRTTRGFGLGLSLAGKIIKIHKGIIEVESDPSSGSLFTIRLPAAQSLRSN